MKEIVCECQKVDAEINDPSAGVQNVFHRSATDPGPNIKFLFVKRRNNWDSLIRRRRNRPRKR